MPLTRRGTHEYAKDKWFSQWMVEEYDAFEKIADAYSLYPHGPQLTKTFLVDHETPSVHFSYIISSPKNECCDLLNRIF